MIVLRSDDDEAVAGCDLPLPLQRHIILRRPIRGRARFGEERHWIIAQVEHQGLDVAAALGQLMDPLRGMIGKPPRADAADDDADGDHGL